MTTYVAAIAATPDVTQDGLYDVSVYSADFTDDPAGDWAMDPVQLPVRLDEENGLDRAEDLAVEVLRDRGWRVIPHAWEPAGNACYADAEPLPGNPLRDGWDDARGDDPE